MGFNSAFKGLIWCCQCALEIKRAVLSLFTQIGYMFIAVEFSAWTPRSCVDQWKYAFFYTSPSHWFEVRGQSHAPFALLSRKEALIHQNRKKADHRVGLGSILLGLPASDLVTVTLQINL